MLDFQTRYYIIYFAAILAGVLLLGCSTATAESTISGSASDADQTARDLTAAAFGVIGASGIDITDSASTRLRGFIEQGAARLSAEEVEAARRDIRSFAEEMVANARFNESAGERVVDLGSFHAALDICPLYPFC